MVHFPAENTHHTEAHPAGQWYDECSAPEAIAWVRDYLVKDLEESADSLLRRADFIDGKASLLFDIMTAAMAKKQDADAAARPA
jgi:hypothetical protein